MGHTYAPVKPIHQSWQGVGVSPKLVRVELIDMPKHQRKFLCLFEDGEEVLVTASQLLSLKRFQAAVLHSLGRVFLTRAPKSWAEDIGRLLDQ